MQFRTHAEARAQARGSPPRWRRIGSVAICLLALACAGSWAAGAQVLAPVPGEAHLLDTVLLAALLAYVLAMALPFVPAIEIGLALMMILGDGGVALVYAATQLALVLSFLIGRWVPASGVDTAFRWLGMERAAGLLATARKAGLGEPVDGLAQRVPGRWAATLGKHRGLALMVALNLPGNAVLGGAGGLGMIAGMSRTIPLARYLLLVAAATTPMPAVLLLRSAL